MSAFTRSHLFEGELLRLIEIEIERLKNDMSLGLIADHNEYRFVAGKIAGLRLAIDYMAEAEAICNGKPRE
jgi:hypothetical protein